MIRKIQAAEYQKRYDNMSAGEQKAYEDRVGEWLRESAPVLMNKAGSFDARLQDVVILSAGWNNRECEAFETGVVLLSALVNGGETWLPDMLYSKSAGRCIKRMCGLLRAVLDENVVTAAMVSQHTGQGVQTPKEEPAAGTKKVTQAVGGNAPFRSKRGRDQDGEVQVGQATVGDALSGEPTVAGVQAVAGMPVRPKHIDQYVHLLPKKTQERAANYGPLMRELDEMREKARLLMDAEGVSSKDCEAVAKRIVAIDKEIGGIKKELDAEWDKLVKAGMVVVDDLGMARVSPASEPSPEGEGNTELTSEDKAKRRSLRKWLVDTRSGNSSEDAVKEHASKWRERFKEYLVLEGEKAFEDDAILKGAEHYGIDVSSLRQG